MNCLLDRNMDEKTKYEVESTEKRHVRHVLSPGLTDVDRQTAC